MKAVSAGAAFVFAFLLLSARNPDHLLRAELWGEDGWVWYPNAYHQGFASLLTPVAGYYQTVSRLVALLAQPLPLTAVPAFFAAAALAIQAAPALFLVSGRMSAAWPDPVSRAGFALAMLVLPNTTEVYANLTNSQWHLAVLAFLVITGRPPRSPAGWCFDLAALTISGLSGPFCVFLVPIALLRAWSERGRATAARALLLLATAAVQAASVLASVHDRTAAPLGGGPRMLARIVVEQILWGGLLGQANMPVLTGLSSWESNVLPLGAAFAATALAIAALVRGPALLRYALLFAAPLFAAAVLRPQISMTLPQWPLMLVPGIGTRYFLIPMLAWLGVIFTLAAGYVPRLRWAGAVLLAVFTLGFRADFLYPERPRTDFQDHARAFAAAPPGTVMSFPVLPPGLPPMILVKKP